MTPEEQEQIDKIQSWYLKCRKITDLDELVIFLQEVKSHSSDYDSRSHIMLVSMLASANCVISNQGMTNDQAIEVFWLFVREWFRKEGPMLLTEFHDMLYPFMEKNFDRVITRNTMNYLQEKASEFLKDGIPATRETIEHWKSIVDGNAPFGYKVVN